MKKLLYCLTLALLSSGLLNACKTKTSAYKPGSYTGAAVEETQISNSPNGEWEVKMLNNKAISAEMEKQPFLNINTESMRMNGNASCNNIMGSILMDKEIQNSISFPNTASTRMMCADMTIETEMLNALKDIVYYKLNSSKNKLELLNANKQVLMVLSPKSTQ